MTQLECGRGRAVVLPPGEPAAQPHPVLMPHGGRRVVTHPPAGRAQPPDEVDVLAYLHVLGKAGASGLFAHHQGRARDVGHPRSRPDDAGPLAHVEGGTCALIPRQPGAPGLVRDDAGRHRTHRGIGEMRQQRVEPAGAGHAVRVEKGHQRRIGGRQPGVPGRGWPAVHRPPQHAGPGRGRDAADRGRIGRAVVHHDHPRRVGQASQATGQFGGPIADRDDHGHGWLSCWRGIVKHRVSDPGVEQAARQRAGLGVIGHRHPRPPGGDMARPRPAQPQHPGGITARDDYPVRQRARPRIGTQAEARRDQLVVRSPSC